ncbi:Ras-related C3 botulinum toxin substrate 1 [Elysia marginata]|uniref:Ras-related C3 botulinum toxin substrate 1 n=1 Tax=Elysia marginata TaxID=1093978 RepID=A0AAV4IB09_9GAST|nr:Ras-related C3 botulinum toxin substrate 1 [Elysia marginata]
MFFIGSSCEGHYIELEEKQSNIPVEDKPPAPEEPQPETTPDSDNLASSGESWEPLERVVTVKLHERGAKVTSCELCLNKDTHVHWHKKYTLALPCDVHFTRGPPEPMREDRVPPKARHKLSSSPAWAGDFPPLLPPVAAQARKRSFVTVSIPPRSLVRTRVGNSEIKKGSLGTHVGVRGNAPVVLDGVRDSLAPRVRVTTNGVKAASHQVQVRPASGVSGARLPCLAESYEDDQSATYVGSFPKGFGYDNEEPELEGATSRGDNKPRILLMGLRRSGKSSIQKVVFHKVSPNETLFLESTNKIIKDDISNSSFVQFQIWDIPGQIDFFDQAFDSEYIFGGCGALIFVIDAQDDYMEALSRLQMAVTRAHKINEAIKFEVFIHKVDGLSDDNKIETQRDILQRATDELADAGMDNIQLSFYLTSIYDHSIFEAFSKVVQKLIPQLPVLENLLDIIISNSKIEKAFLFDVVSKIYIATDSSPVDMQCYELCCDMIDVVIDMSCIYGIRDDGAFDNESGAFIKLNSGTVLFLREVNRHLALVCILREDGCEHRGIIEYNFKCFRNAIQEVFVARNKQTSGSDGMGDGNMGLTIGSSGASTGDTRMDRVVRSLHGDDSDLRGLSTAANGHGHGMMNGMLDRDNTD